MIKPVEYKQNDPRWGKKSYSAPGESATIASAGCGPTCMAMVIATLADISVTPVETVKWSLENKFKAFKQGTYYTYFTPQGAKYGIEVVRVNTENVQQSKNARTYHDMVVDAIADGHMVICCMGPGHWTKGGHYILLYGIEGMNAIISDPATSAANRARAPLSTLFKEVKYYWIVKVPKADEIDVVAKNIRTKGYIKVDTSYVPVRAVAEAFGATVGWSPTNEKVTVNSWPIEIENKGGIAFAKARTLGDLLGLKVDWASNTRTVTFKKG